MGADVRWPWGRDLEATESEAESEYQNGGRGESERVTLRPKRDNTRAGGGPLQGPWTIIGSGTSGR